MTLRAHVRSLQSLPRFQAELQRYRWTLNQVVEMLLVEVHRAEQWLEEDRARYWQRQQKMAEWKLTEAQANLSRCMTRTRADQPRSCFSEKKIVEGCRARVAEVERKFRRLRSCIQLFRRESEAFQMQVRRLSIVSDDDLARAVASLVRLQRYLNKYIQLRPPETRAGRGPSDGRTLESRSGDAGPIQDTGKVDHAAGL